MIGLVPLLIVGLAPAPMESGELPITFAREGQEVVIRIAQTNRPAAASIILSAYGRTWLRVESVDQGQVKFVAPKVRVPTAFVLSSADSGQALGEVVVYPKRPVPWSSDVRLMAIDAPPWFGQWAVAIGLPLENITSPRAMFDTPRKRWHGELLVIGREMAGETPATAWELAAKYGTNLLVLDAAWFGPSQPFAAKQTHDVAKLHPPRLEGLKDLLPPVFERHRLPWPGISNRLSWVTFEDEPLVEELRDAQRAKATARVVVSYLPWKEQLGRRETTDRGLINVLAEAARRISDRPPLAGQLHVLYPNPATIKSGERPVLAAVKAGNAMDVSNQDMQVSQNRASIAYVLDLRGTVRTSVLEQYADTIHSAEDRINRDTPLLILGDDPWLNQWKWLKLDREHLRSQQSGVLWWPDKSLPASSKDQWRLMEFLTDSNIPLRDLSQEK